MAKAVGGAQDDQQHDHCHRAAEDCLHRQTDGRLRSGLAPLSVRLQPAHHRHRLSHTLCSAEMARRNASRLTGLADLELEAGPPHVSLQLRARLFEFRRLRTAVEEGGEGAVRACVRGAPSCQLPAPPPGLQCAPTHVPDAHASGDALGRGRWGPPARQCPTAPHGRGSSSVRGE